MARNEKGSRNRGLPPYVRKQIEEAATGSFPTVSRTSVDNRHGRYNVAFNDTSALRFGFHAGGEFNPTVSDSTIGYSATSLYSWWPIENFGISGSRTSTPDLGLASLSIFASGAWGTGYTDPQYQSQTNLVSAHLLAYTSGADYAFLASGSNLGNIFDFSPNSPFSFAAHVNFDTFPQTYNAVVWRGVANFAFADWEVMVTDTGKIIAAVFQNTTGKHRVAETAAGLITAGTWYHITVTFDGTANFQFYLNGILQSSSVTFDNGWPSFSSSTNGRFGIGQMYDGDFVGLTPGTTNLYVDQIAIFGRVITAAEAMVLAKGHQNGVVISTGLPVSSQYLTSEITTGIVTGSYVKSGIGDKWIAVNQSGEDLHAFVDSDHAAMDGMALASVSASYGSFYKTGSSIVDAGPGFQQSLWDKTKIEIDLTPSIDHSFGITNFTSGSSSFSMAYFNRTTKRWSGVGSGIEPINYSGTTLTKTSIENLLTFFNEKAVGFGGGLTYQANSLQTSGAYILGNPISNFGFPFHEKYSGSSDTTFLMSDYINEPFLLEKVVVYWSGAYENGTSGIYSSVSNFTTANTFFILNERNSPYPFKVTQTVGFISGTTAIPVLDYNITSSLSSSKVRDLVTWLQIVKNAQLPEPFSLYSKKFIEGREKVYTSEDNFSGQLVMSGVVKNPLEFTKGMSTILTSQGAAPFNTTGQLGPEYFETWKETGRNNTGDRGRNWKNTLLTPEVVGSFNVTNLRGGQTSVTVNKQYYKNNAYILLPTDRLIFGWQVNHLLDAWNYYAGLPVYNGNGPKLSFSSAGIHKVVLYGSLLRVGQNGELQEYHDTLNQHLTSVSIHEVIGS